MCCPVSLFPAPLVEACIYGALTRDPFPLWRSARKRLRARPTCVRPILRVPRPPPLAPLWIGGWCRGVAGRLSGTAMGFRRGMLRVAAGFLGPLVLLTSLGVRALTAWGRRGRRSWRWALAAPSGGSGTRRQSRCLSWGWACSCVGRPVGQIDPGKPGPVPSAMTCGCGTVLFLVVPRDQCRFLRVEDMTCCVSIDPPARHVRRP